MYKSHNPLQNNPEYKQNYCIDIEQLSTCADSKDGILRDI